MRRRGIDAKVPTSICLVIIDISQLLSHDCACFTTLANVLSPTFELLYKRHEIMRLLDFILLALAIANEAYPVVVPFLIRLPTTYILDSIPEAKSPPTKSDE